jgi:hypothetical protein
MESARAKTREAFRGHPQYAENSAPLKKAAGQSIPAHDPDPALDRAPNHDLSGCATLAGKIMSKIKIRSRKEGDAPRLTSGNLGLICLPFSGGKPGDERRR